MRLHEHLPSRVRRFLVSPRMQLALKGSAAAALAWLVAETATRSTPGHGLEDYIYYAPFGAVVATDATIAGSWRIARQSALALLLGAVLGVAVDRALEPGTLSLVVVVVVGVLLGSLPGMGTQRSWVPIAALFVLLIGHGRQTEEYATAYVGLTALGACCGVLINLLVPTLPLARHHEALQRLKQELAGQLGTLAGGLREQQVPGLEVWRDRSWDAHDTFEQSQQLLAELLEAERGNVLEARRRRTEVRRQTEVLRTLARVAFLVEDLLVALPETYRLDSAPLDLDLAAVIAHALDDLGQLVLVFDDDLRPDDPRVLAAEGSIRELTDEFGRRRDLHSRDVALLGGVVANLRRCTDAIHPTGL